MMKTVHARIDWDQNSEVLLDVNGEWLNSRQFKA